MDIRTTAALPAAPERDASASVAKRGAALEATPATSTTTTNATSATSTAAPAKPARDSDVADAVSAINKSLKAAGQNVEFTVDKDSQRTVIKVIDQETQQVLRQMPTQEALELAKAMDRSTGRLIQNEA